jgi:hypothetical protein
MNSNEMLWMTMMGILIATVLFGIMGYLAEYLRYVVRFYRHHGKKTFKRGIRYLKRL